MKLLAAKIFFVFSLAIFVGPAGGDDSSGFVSTPSDAVDVEATAATSSEEPDIQEQVPVTDAEPQQKTPQQITVLRQHRYFISHGPSEARPREATSEDSGFITRVEKGETEVFASGLIRPHGLAVDTRRGMLYVTDRGTLKIYKIKKPDQDPQLIKILPNGEEGEEGELGYVTFSIMNRRAYVTDTVKKTIWEVNPKKKTVSKLLGESAFEELGKGSPTALLASTDGRRLYVTTSASGMEENKGAAVLEISLKKKTKITVLKTFPEWKSLEGIAFYRKHYLVFDAATKDLWAVHQSGKKPPKRVTPANLDFDAMAFAMDLNMALFLGPHTEGKQAKVASFPIKLK